MSLFGLDLVQIMDKLLQILQPIYDKGCLLFQVEALIQEWLIMLEEVVILLKLNEDVIDACDGLLGRYFVLFQHLSLFEDVFSLLSIEELLVHVLYAQVLF